MKLKQCQVIKLVKYTMILGLVAVGGFCNNRIILNLSFEIYKIIVALALCSHEYKYCSLEEYPEVMTQQFFGQNNCLDIGNQDVVSSTVKLLRHV